MEEQILEELRKINRQLGQISKALVQKSEFGEVANATNPGAGVRAEIERARAEAMARFSEIATENKK